MSAYYSSYRTSDVANANSAAIDPFLGGTKWGGSLGTGVSLTYSFPWTTQATAHWQNGYSSEPYARNHYGFSLYEENVAQTALESWSDYANITFTKIAETGIEVGDFRFAFSSAVADQDSWGWTRLPDSQFATAADIWISTSLDSENMNFSLGGYGYESLLHEIGHGLGLKHPGDYYNGAESGPFISENLDDTLHSIMSYNDPVNNDWYDAVTQTTNSLYAQTPMVYDIRAMQYLYGINPVYHNEDDAYHFDDRAPFRETIWDTGGMDSISVENSLHTSLIDLTPGSYSSIQTNRAYNLKGISTVYDGTYNLGIADDVIIENAYGGQSHDVLFGNAADNLLMGNDGNDTIRGEGGNDTLVGGNGDDIFVYDGEDDGSDTITDWTSGDSIEIIGADLTNVGILSNRFELLRDQVCIEYSEMLTTLYVGIDNNIGFDLSLNFTGYLEAETLDFYGDTIGYNEASLPQMFFATVDNDDIDGGGGTDTLSYRDAVSAVMVNLGVTAAQVIKGSGVDTIVNIENLIGSRFNDTLIGDINSNELSGESGNDKLYGYGGDDTINGGESSDSMDGGDGDDTYYVDAKGDKVIEKQDSGYDVIITYIDYIMAKETEELIAEGVFGLNLRGNNANNNIIGCDGNDTIDGLLGDDWIIGGSGKDNLKGGKGADCFVYTSTDDSRLDSMDIISDFTKKNGDKIDLSLLLGVTFESLVITAGAKETEAILSIDTDHNGISDFGINMRLVGSKYFDLNGSDFIFS